MLASQSREDSLDSKKIEPENGSLDGRSGRGNLGNKGENILQLWRNPKKIQNEKKFTLN